MVGMGRRARTRERERGRHSGTDSLVRPGAVGADRPGERDATRGARDALKRGALGRGAGDPASLKSSDVGGHTDRRTNSF